MCDVESYIYLPLLEEMGYMPKHKYSYGQEILAYINAVAEKYGVADKAMFRTKVDLLEWDETAKDWIVSMTKYRKNGGSLKISTRSQFVMIAAGVLVYPHLPDIPGIEEFKGHNFHTARWDYDCTGGTPEAPEMVGLKDKRVGVIGTGATAVQLVPHLAKWAKELIVFQRTASQVDSRGQRETDIEWWQKEVQGRKGWQKDRSKNFNGHLTSALPPDSLNMVEDEWSKMRAYCALIGKPGILRVEDIPAHVAEMHTRDLPRSERIRARTDEIVIEKKTADDLKSWYPSWCKRPTFHDDYLPTYNQPHVKLVNTKGKGIESLTSEGVCFDGQEYPLDVLIWSTGFRAPVLGDPSATAGMTVMGRGGLHLSEKWKNDLGTLHGVVSRDFPNLFWPGPWQGAASANFTGVINLLCSHVAYMVTQAEKTLIPGVRFSIEPTKDAEQAWSMQIAMRAGALAATSGCTPSYLNREGALDRLSMEERMALAKMSIWGEGILSFTEVLEKWQEDGILEGLEIRY
jgi:cation diffusion facilitator CzcD-associated flavoprotein CzcO